MVRHLSRTGRTSFTVVDNGWVHWSILEYRLWLDASSSYEDVSYIWLVANEDLILSKYFLKRSDERRFESSIRCDDVQSTMLGWRIESRRGMYFSINLKWRNRWTDSSVIGESWRLTIDRQRLNSQQGCPFLMGSTAEENWSQPFPLRPMRLDFDGWVQWGRISSVALGTSHSSSLE